MQHKLGQYSTGKPMRQLPACSPYSLRASARTLCPSEAWYIFPAQLLLRLLMLRPKLKDTETQSQRSRITTSSVRLRLVKHTTSHGMQFRGGKYQLALTQESKQTLNEHNLATQAEYPGSSQPQGSQLAMSLQSSTARSKKKKTKQNFRKTKRKNWHVSAKRPFI